MQIMTTTQWQKSSFSADNNNCLEVAACPHESRHLRESDAPTVILTTTPTRLQALLHLARSSFLG